MTTRAYPWQAALLVLLVLGVVYGATAAPSLTFWDASEFATAIATFGIPHPPGTPLYIAIGTAVWRLVPAVSPVQAGTLVSAAATALACALLAWITASVGGRRSTAAIAGVCAGVMGTVWMNATETEVYAVALLSVAAQCAFAWRAYRDDDARARVLLAYVAALSVPLHLSALVATPAAMYLASTSHHGRVQWRSLLGGGALVLATVMLSRGALVLSIASLLMAGVVAVVPMPFTRRVQEHKDDAGHANARWLLPAIGLTLLAWSAVAILPLRAAHSPLLNMGAPDGVTRLLDVISRAQYDVAPLWPRRAPFWLQLGNIGQYADWQVALGLWNEVTPSLLRTPFTVLALLLGVIGAVAHWRSHRITARAALLLLALATVGVCVQLNLRAGPSFGVGALTADALHEAREREYFYALAFWLWGAWIGVGSVALARSWRWRARSAVLVPCAMIVGNWSAVTRSVAPDRTIATATGNEFLHDVPHSGLLLTAGDNDTYPLWYRQAAHGVRPDVQVVVMSLLPANWYLLQRMALIDRHPADTLGARSATARAAQLARAQLARGGAVAVSMLVASDVRSELGSMIDISCWRRAGVVDIAARGERCPPRIDGPRTAASAERLRGFARTTARTSSDGMVSTFLTITRCPALAVQRAVLPQSPSDPAARALLDITCNLR